MQHTQVSKMTIKSALALAVITGICTGNAYAKQSDFKEAISINSGKQIAELSTNKITFLDHVIINQGTIKITADKVEILRNEKGQIKSATAFGSPATFYQILDNGKPVTAHSRKIAYYPISQTVELKESAVIEQGSSKITSDSITYNIAKERMEASSGNKQNGDRVTTVFVPEELKAQIEENKNAGSGK